MSIRNQVMGAAGASSVTPTYIEDVFNQFIYNGNGSSQTVPGPDMTLGGIAWIKDRKNSQYNHIFDTTRGANVALFSNDVLPNTTVTGSLTAFTATGISIGSSANVNGTSASYANAPQYIAWMFRNHPNFVSQGTYTGNGVAGRQIAHGLKGTPGCVMVKRIDGSGGSWVVYHRGLSSANYAVLLNYTNAQILDTTYWNSTAPNATSFTVGDSGSTNQSGAQYVWYAFAHNAGGFGLTGTDNVISCGSFSMPIDGSSSTVDVGFEPQWVLVKDVKHSQNWWIIDTLRGWAAPTGATNGAGGQMYAFFANTSAAEGDYYNYGGLTANGFKWPSNFNYADGNTDYIYIAIRRGPMKVPTDATKVFKPVVQTTTDPTTVTTGFPVDLLWWRNGRSVTRNNYSHDRLTGGMPQLRLNTADAEQSAAPYGVYFDSNTSIKENWSGAGQDSIFLNFRRAPGFFDQVCFKPTGVAHMEPHNLGVVPELIIGKQRDNAVNWLVYAAPLGNTQAISMNTTDAPVSGSYLWNNTSPTASAFSLGNSGLNSTAGTRATAFLFASCPGVSKIGTYAGSASDVTVNCGFSNGARFVMIRRLDAAGDWWYFDTARGIVAAGDAYLRLNSSAAEGNADTIDPASSGFTMVGNTSLNDPGGTFLYLAIA